jgi:hypothetical protein
MYFINVSVEIDSELEYFRAISLSQNEKEIMEKILHTHTVLVGAVFVKK